MLTKLGTRHEGELTVRDRLLDCHERIRKFCALAKRLSEGAPAQMASEAAAQLHRYFSVALPLHMRDEDESLRPRLERIADANLSAALEAMSNEHVTADVHLAELIDQWSAIADEATDERCLATRTGALWINAYMSRHLHDEETRIFPALDLLPAAQWDAIVAEMQARRR
jgi:hemerythrin-like domain-containing protein